MWFSVGGRDKKSVSFSSVYIEYEASENRGSVLYTATCSALNIARYHYANILESLHLITNDQHYCKRLKNSFTCHLIGSCSPFAFFSKPWKSWGCCCCLCMGVFAQDCSMLCLGRARACSPGSARSCPGLVSSRWEAASLPSSPFPKSPFSSHKGSVLTGELQEQRARRVYPTWNTSGFERSSGSVAARKSIEARDELFWQVGVVLPAQLIFRGFPISPSAKQSCGRILFGFFLIWGFKLCKQPLSGWWAKLGVKTLANTRRTSLRAWKADTKFLCAAKIGWIVLISFFFTLPSSHLE